MSLHLTNPFGEKGKSYSQTYPGMASWSVLKDTCRECEFFKPDGYYSVNGKHRGGLKPGKCLKYKGMMGRWGSSFPYDAKACKHFNLNPKPPGINIK